MLLLLALPAYATIINVLSPTIGAVDPGWKGSVKAGTKFLYGNEERIAFNLAAGLRYRKENHLFSLRATGDLGLAFRETVSQKAFFNIRHRYMIHKPVSTLVFAQVDHNRFRGLVVRDLIGGGVDILLWRNTWTEAHLGLSVMAEHQLHGEGFIDDDSGLRARMSDYFTVAVKTETMVLASTTFLQPRIDQPDNLRLLQDLSMTLDISEHLDWNVRWKTEYDTHPPTGVKPFDLALTSGLVLGF